MPFKDICKMDSARVMHEGEDFAYCILSSDDDCMEFIDSLPFSEREAIKSKMGEEVSMKDNTLLYLALESLEFLFMYASSKLDKGMVCVAARNIDGLTKYIDSLSEIGEEDRILMYDLIAG